MIILEKDFNNKRHMRLYNILITIALLSISAPTFANEPFFTTGIALSERGEIVLTQRGTNRIDVFSADGNRLLRSFDILETPTGICVDGNRAYITTFETKGMLLIMNLTTGRIEAQIPVGSGACNPILSHDRQKVYVSNRFSNTVSEVDVRQRRVVRTAPAVREPRSSVLSNDGKFLFVANFLPAGRADVDVVTACVTVIETTNFTKVKDIQLANGSNALRDMCITPDGKYIYVTHNLGRFTVPTSQLQQGWMNTSAFSVIDVEKQEYLGVVLVDEPERGAAGVWGIRCNEDHIYVTHSGTHEVSIIDHPAMLKKFLAHPNRELLDYDLRFLFGLRTRVPLEGNGPRELYLSNDKVFIPTYFADVLNIIDISSGELTAVVLNPDRFETSEHMGERIFNDANNCFQNWQSCNGCHPGDARMDGLNWDLMNDGIGNPKNCKSLLYSHVTPPSMISGIRESAELAVRMGFRLIQFFDIDEESAAHVDNYLMSLRPVPSPFLVNGELSEKAVRGRAVFEQLRCDRCHSGPYFTDMKMHRIGDDIEFEKGWDTPTLIEVWRTAPYLFDGRAATLEEVFTIHKHGVDPEKITPEEMEALVEYVNSL
jgi:DNA-binding beta-propeller fold protein YncE